MCSIGLLLYHIVVVSVVTNIAYFILVLIACLPMDTVSDELVKLSNVLLMCFKVQINIKLKQINS